MTRAVTLRALRGVFVLAGAGLLIAVTVTATQAPSSPLGIGRLATADEIRKLGIDVMPDGRGLPVGGGTVAEGVAVYAAKCASCHGVKGEGGTADRLVGRTEGDSFAFATNSRLVKTIGSYWPYATTLYDYIARAMPFQQPGTLTPNETYGLVAYLLFLNGVIAEQTVMDQTSVPQVMMPARDRFRPDNRSDGPAIR